VGDPLRIRPIVSNLLSNGVKFMQTGGIEVRVRMTGPLQPRRPSRSRCATPGSASSRVSRRVFEEFVQAGGSTTCYYGGTGRGLVIVAASRD
jgi:signal transduction histidine kinase